jgi:hypothetical protein
MASLSIARRKQAWAAGVACGATGRGVCELIVPKLKEIYERGVAFGKANPDKPEVKAIVAERTRPPAPKPLNRPPRRPMPRRRY